MTEKFPSPIRYIRVIGGKKSLFRHPLRIVCLLALLPLAVLTGKGQTEFDPKLGLQAWSFNRDSFVEMVDKAGALDIKNLQAFPRQKLGEGLPGKFEPSMDAATREKLLALLKKKGISLVSFGVVRADDEAGWRELFEFAKAMGIADLTVEPPADALPLLNGLSNEYGVTVSIHNHGGNLEERLEQLAPYGPNLGLCADTGHWVRNGRNAVSSLALAKGRLHSLHLKDMSAADKEAHTMPWGTGVSDFKGQLAELKKQGFSGYIFIEYEHRTPELDANVKSCVQAYTEALAAMKSVPAP